MTRFRAFLADSEKRILPVHGPGGIGKTRFLWECGRDTLTSVSESAWDVFWVNVASMAHSEHWFEHLIPERPTLILIDEPENALTLERLDEQMASRCKNWRAVVATRTSFDPIMEWLKNRRHRAVADAIELPKLERDCSVALAASLLRAKLLRDLPEEHPRVLELARRVTRICDDHPVWIGIAVELLEKNGSTALLPSDTRGVASQYLDEAIEHAAKRTGTSSAALKTLVRWLALFQPLNMETDRDALDFVAREANLARISQVQNALTALAERRIVRKRDHVCEIKPDVMSDFTLRAWLVDTSRPQGCSYDADDLIQRMGPAFEGEPFPKLLQVIRMLARLELQCRLQGNTNVDLVGAIAAQARKLAEDPMAAARLKSPSTNPREAIFGVREAFPRGRGLHQRSLRREQRRG
jgi:hypothetical protein